MTITFIVHNQNPKAMYGLTLLDKLILYLFDEIDADKKEEFLQSELHTDSDLKELLHSYESTLKKLDELNPEPSQKCIDNILQKAKKVHHE